MKYSVIIPTYNAEGTLNRCLDSLLKQLPSNAELILVNDGSTDNSGEICKSYASKNPNVRYFEKENGGVSSARNLALDNARGEYILFADSDDYVAEDYFEVIDSALSEKHPDMLLFGWRSFGGNSSAWSSGGYYCDSENTVAAKAGEAIREYLFSSLWSKVFKREIIERNRLRFREELAIGEDQTFIFSYTTHIKSLMSVDNLLYNCNVENQNSLSRKRRDYLTEQLLKSNLEMIAFLKSSELSAQSKRTYMGALSWMFYRGAYSCSKELLKYDLNPKQRRRKIKEICRRFCREHIKPADFKCLIIALPVKLRLAFVIDYLIKR